MNYVQQQAHQNLSDYIRCYWKIENRTSNYQYFTVFPDGFFDLLICYTNGNLIGVFLTGLWNEETNVVISPETTVYGVQFRLLAIENIIQESISPILNDIKRLKNSFWGLNEFQENSESCLFEYLNEHLLSHRKEQDQIDPRKRILLKSINESKGTKTVEYYAQTAHWSQRQINRYFHATFGLSLKSYSSIRKGSAMFSPIKKGQLFPQQGFYDQSHFIKGIKKITGFTPKELLKNENDRFLQFSIIKSK